MRNLTKLVTVSLFVIAGILFLGCHLYWPYKIVGALGWWSAALWRMESK